MKLVQATTLADAWLQACQHLLSSLNWTDTTVVLHIREPSLIRPEDERIASELDHFLTARGHFSNHTVAETIFPGYEYVRRGVDGVYLTYPNEIYPKIKDHPEMRRWGTYAYRLLRRQTAEGEVYNPLQHCIEKMKDSRPMRAAYELDLGYTCDLATYEDQLDGNRRMGGPCLSHLSFKLLTREVHLTAVYRAHHYVHRAYGNLLGLARLQAFVADQVNAGLGPLVCHSTLALLEHGGSYGWGKGDVRRLIARCDRPAALSSQGASQT